MDNKTKPALNMRYYNKELMMIYPMLVILITMKRPDLSTTKRETL